MAQTVLSLVVEKGPKAGHRLECKPSTVTTIGRARRNTLQISKDSGISQNHLRFKWTEGSSGNREYIGWIVEDAGSSNGTILNDGQIEAAKPAAIKPGDLIKIGAETTIRIDILPAISQPKSEVKARGTSRRKGAASCAGADTHKEKPEKVVKEADIVRKEPENAGKQPDKAGKEPDKVGKELENSRKEPENARKEHENAGNEPENVGSKSASGVEGDNVDLNATVEQWFHLMMEGGRNYIYKISESIIQEVTQESERFDESVRSM